MEDFLTFLFLVETYMSLSAYGTLENKTKVQIGKCRLVSDHYNLGQEKLGSNIIQVIACPACDSSLHFHDLQKNIEIKELMRQFIPIFPC